MFVLRCLSERRGRAPSAVVPGVFNLSVDETVKEAAAAKADGVNSVILFGIGSKDDASDPWPTSGSAGQSAIRATRGRRRPGGGRHLPLQLPTTATAAS
jgi:delta-aminolevulinic acid dehydratase/porphobilinogen synthase